MKTNIKDFSTSRSSLKCSGPSLSVSNNLFGLDVLMVEEINGVRVSLGN